MCSHLWRPTDKTSAKKFAMNDFMVSLRNCMSYEEMKETIDTLVGAVRSRDDGVERRC